MTRRNQASVTLSSLTKSQQEAQASELERLVPAFLTKLLQILEDPKSEGVIEWNDDGTSFTVLDPVALAQDTLPKHFKHSNFQSFVRQLNMYGFRKASHDIYEFVHPQFIRGKPELLQGINRRVNLAKKKDTTREEPALILQQVMELKRNQEEYERNLQELTERHQSMEEENAHLRNELTATRERQAQMMAGLRGMMKWIMQSTGMKYTPELEQRTAQRLIKAAADDENDFNPLERTISKGAQPVCLTPFMGNESDRSDVRVSKKRRIPEYTQASRMSDSMNQNSAEDVGNRPAKSRPRAQQSHHNNDIPSGDSSDDDLQKMMRFVDSSQDVGQETSSAVIGSPTFSGHLSPTLSFRDSVTNSFSGMPPPFTTSSMGGSDALVATTSFGNGLLESPTASFSGSTLGIPYTGDTDEMYPPVSEGESSAPLMRTTSVEGQQLLRALTNHSNSQQRLIKRIDDVVERTKSGEYRFDPSDIFLNAGPPE